MTEADIAPLLKPLVEGKAYPYIVKQTAAGVPAVSPPWLVFSLSAQSNDVLSGQAETQNSLQIDVYASTIDEARSLREQVKVAITSLSPVSVSELNGYESDTALFRATLEIQIWE